MLSYHCAEGESDSSDVIFCQRTATSFILQADGDSQPACHEDSAAQAKRQSLFLLGFKQLAFHKIKFPAREKKKKYHRLISSYTHHSKQTGLTVYCSLVRFDTPASFLHSVPLTLSLLFLFSNQS